MKKLTSDPDSMALWLHPLYGARTLSDIAHMQELAHAVPKSLRSAVPVPHDNYTDQEDRFIDRNGFSSALF